MSTTRLVVNLVTFLALSVLVIGWAAVSLFGRDTAPPMTATAVFAEAAGLTDRTDVTYRGQRIGRIAEVTLQPDGVDVVLGLDTDLEIPQPTSATVRRRSAVGEPFVDLSGPTGPDQTGVLGDGDVIPLERTAVPPAFSVLFERASAFFDAVDPDDLDVVLEEIAAGLDGRGDELQTILREGGSVAQTFGDNAGVLDEAVVEVGRLADLFERRSTDLDRAIDGGIVVGDRLGQLADEFEAVVADDTDLPAMTADLVPRIRDPLGCTLGSLAVVAAALDDPTLGDLEVLLQDVPEVREVVAGTQTIREDGLWVDVVALLTDEEVDRGTEATFPEPRDPAACDPPTAASTVPAGESDTPVGDAGAPAPSTFADAPTAADGGGGDADEVAARDSSQLEVADRSFPLVPVLAGLGLLAALALVRPWRLLSGSGPRGGR